MKEITVYLSEEDHELVRARGRDRGLSCSAWIRGVLVGELKRRMDRKGFDQLLADRAEKVMREMLPALLEEINSERRCEAEPDSGGSFHRPGAPRRFPARGGANPDESEQGRP